MKLTLLDCTIDTGSLGAGPNLRYGLKTGSASADRKISRCEYWSYGGAGFIGSHLCERLQRTGTKLSAWTTFSAASGPISPTCAAIPSFELVRLDVVEPILVEVDNVLSISPVWRRPVQNTSTIRSRLPRLTSWAPSTCWVWPSASKRASCSRPPARSTATLQGEHPQKENLTGDTSIRSASAPATTKANGSGRMPDRWTTVAKTRSIPTDCPASSTPMRSRMAIDDGRVLSNFVSPCCGVGHHRLPAKAADPFLQPVCRAT